MKTLLLTFLIAASAHAAKVDSLHVVKSQRKLELLDANKKVIKTYKIMLGRNPVGDKVQEGDNKTPEGTYTLDLKNPDSSFHKSFHISYPTLKQKMKAKFKGVNPGGDIMLHGLPNDFSDMTSWLEKVDLNGFSEEVIREALVKFDWTNGCIAVTDAEIDEIWDMVDVPTKIVIEP